MRFNIYSKKLIDLLRRNGVDIIINEYDYIIYNNDYREYISFGYKTEEDWKNFDINEYLYNYIKDLLRNKKLQKIKELLY